MRYFFPAFLFLIFSSISFLSFAQTLNQKIEKSFKELESDPNVKNGFVSLTVMDQKTGEIVFAKNEHIGLAPASTLKTITAATAYSVLGSNFTYKTDLSYTGEIDAKGTLHGDIIIKGSGDPTLGSDHFKQSHAEVLLHRWVAAIKAKGIKKIEGRIIGDDLLFNGQQAPGGWTWIDMGNYYGAGVSSLNWRENTFNVILTAGSKEGEVVKLVRTEPDLSSLTILNELKTGKAGSGDQVYGYSAPYSSIIHLRGTYGIDLNKKISLSIPDGAYDLALSLKSFLEIQGISVDKEATTSFLLSHSGIQLPSQTHLLNRYISPNLSQIEYWLNRRSINLYGEALLKTVAIHENQNPSTEEICKWQEKYWEEKLGISPGELLLKDGSGLSPETRVTTLAMTKIMNYSKKQPWFTSFYENLPTNNGMKMKSGTIGGVLGYTGYHTTSTGRALTFSLLINNYTGSAPSMRQKMFKMLNSLK
jgi:D-alanyl-D-alanine carboxypeptidase/D-alanyl-D-alanine-endopeptidase (penicillin-binding protein 4)